MSLLIKSHSSGRTMVQLPAGELEYVGFAAYRLSLGETLPVAAADKELCLVLLSGRISLKGRRRGRAPSIGTTSVIANRCSKTSHLMPLTCRPAARPRSLP